MKTLLHFKRIKVFLLFVLFAMASISLTAQESSVYFSNMTTPVTAPATSAVTSASFSTSALTGWTGYSSATYPGYVLTSSSTGGVTLTFTTPIALSACASSGGSIVLNWGHNSSGKNINVTINGGASAVAGTNTAAKTVTTSTYAIPSSITSISTLKISGSSSSGMHLFSVDIKTCVILAKVTVAPTTLTGFTYAQGLGPSAAQQFNVSGTTLTTGSTIKVDATPNYEYSLDGTTYSPSVTIPNAAGGTLAATPVYVRLKAGLTQNASYPGTINVSGGGDPTVYPVTVAGSVTAPTLPTLTVTPALVSGLNYVFNTGPSAVKSFDVSGVLLTNEDVKVSLPGAPDFEVSISPTGPFASTAFLPQPGGTLNPTPIYVRLKAGLAINTYSLPSIKITGGGFASSVSTAFEGSVIAAPLSAPIVGAPSAAIEDGFTAAWTPVTSATGYIVNVYQGTTFIKAVNVAGQATATVDVNGLSGSTAYTYKVIAVGDGVSYSNSVESAASASITTLVASVLTPSPCDVTLFQTDFTDWYPAPGGGSGSDLLTQAAGAGTGYVLTGDMVVNPNAGTLYCASGRTMKLAPYNFIAGGKVIITIDNTSTSNRVYNLTGSGNDGAITSSAVLVSGTGVATCSANQVAVPKSTSFVVTYVLPPSVVGTKQLTIDMRETFKSIIICSGAGTNPVLTTVPYAGITQKFSALIGGNTNSGIIQVKGFNLTGDVTLSIEGPDAGYFSLPVTTIPSATAMIGKNMGIVYKSSVAVKQHFAVLKIESAGAAPVYVNLTGASVENATPRIIAPSGALQFATSALSKTSNTISVGGISLTGNVTISFTGPDASRFSVGSSTILKNDALAGSDIEVKYQADIEVADHTANMVLSSPGAADIIIPLAGKTLESRPVKYSVVFQVSPAGAGFVEANYQGTSFLAGTVLTVKATAEKGWKLDRWNDGLGGSGLNRTITMNSNKGTIIVYFVPGVQDTSTVVDPTGGLKIYVPTAITQTSMNLSWSAVTSATTYTLTVYDQAGVIVGTPQVLSATNSNVTGLVPGSIYSFSVASDNGENSGKIGPFQTLPPTVSTFICGQ